MFNNFTQWHWVALSWAHLIVFYLGYIFYLRWRAKQAEARLEDET